MRSSGDPIRPCGEKGDPGGRHYIVWIRDIILLRLSHIISVGSWVMEG
jgi:hypothetical protein